MIAPPMDRANESRRDSTDLENTNWIRIAVLVAMRRVREAEMVRLDREIAALIDEGTSR